MESESVNFLTSSVCGSLSLAVQWTNKDEELKNATNFEKLSENTAVRRPRKAN